VGGAPAKWFLRTALVIACSRFAGSRLGFKKDMPRGNCARATSPAQL
jgi:hypothetical protein